MVLESMDRHQVIGQGHTCEQTSSARSDKDIELPGATENTTAWELSKLLAADRIAVVPVIYTPR